MKLLQKQLQSAVKTLNTLATKIDGISKKLGATEKAKPAPTKKSQTKATRKPAASKTVKKSAPKKAVKESAPQKAVVETGSDKVLKIISGSKKGVNTTVLVKKTGFNTKKVRNTVFRLRKQGKIKSAAKGIYIKA